MKRLQLQGLSVPMLEPVDLELEPGQWLGLQGPSGAGKTMLLRAIADLDPHGGRMLLDGVESSHIQPPAWRRQVGYLASESAWWLDTVGPHLDGVSLRWLQALGFDRQVLKWSVARLSSGERQRLALLRMLASRPRVLLLDEPTANLDRQAVKAVEDLLADYSFRHQAAVIWVGHDTDQLCRLCDHIFAISGGRLVPMTAGGGAQ